MYNLLLPDKLQSIRLLERSYRRHRLQSLMIQVCCFHIYDYMKKELRQHWYIPNLIQRYKYYYNHH